PTSCKLDTGKIGFAPPFPDVTTKRGTFVRRHQKSSQSIETIRSHQAKCGKLRQSFFNLRRQQSAAAHQFAAEERPAICKCVEPSSAGAREFHLRIRLRQHQPMREVLTLIKRDGAAS